MPTNPKKYPLVTTPDDTVVNEGMTLRDEFAGRAVQGYFSIPEHWDIDVKSNKILQEQIADIAYKVADAMLESREKV